MQHARAPRNAFQSPAAVGTFSASPLPRCSSTISTSSYSREPVADHEQLESDSIAAEQNSLIIAAVVKEVKSVIKVSTDSIEKKFTAVETKLGIVEAAVKELSTIVKSTHTFSIQGSVYEVYTVNLIDTVE